MSIRKDSIARVRQIARDWSRDKLGLDVRPYDIQSSFSKRLNYLIELHNIELILDVGANIGQFGRSIFNDGYGGRIISFEAIPSIHQILQDTAKLQGDRWLVAPCCALSAEEGTTVFHVTKSAASSSLFPATEKYNSLAPIRLEETIVVDTQRLDDALLEFNVTGCNTLIKLDVQGAEDIVLAGGMEALGRSKVVLTEMSTASLYEGQTLYNELDEKLRTNDFKLWDIVPVYRDSDSGELLQFDALYVKSA